MATKQMKLGTEHPKLRGLNQELAELAFRIWSRDHRKAEDDPLLFELWLHLAKRDHEIRTHSGQHGRQVALDRGFSREDFEQWRDAN